MSIFKRLDAVRLVILLLAGLMTEPNPPPGFRNLQHYYTSRSGPACTSFAIGLDPCHGSVCRAHRSSVKVLWRAICRIFISTHPQDRCLRFHFMLHCHGRGREFEPRRPRHSFENLHRFRQNALECNRTHFRVLFEPSCRLFNEFPSLLSFFTLRSVWVPRAARNGSPRVTANISI